MQEAVRRATTPALAGGAREVAATEELIDYEN